MITAGSVYGSYKCTIRRTTDLPIIQVLGSDVDIKKRANTATQIPVIIFSGRYVV